MFLVRKHYPADYAKICRFFPFVGASVMKFELENPDLVARYGR